MEKLEITPDTFENGSWVSLKIEDCNLLHDVTPLDIKRNLNNVFHQSYKIASKFAAIEDMICFKMVLEEIPKAKAKKKKIPKELQTFEFKIAVSVKDSIMFCNLILNAKFRDLFAQVFEATALSPYDLLGSPPYQLLLLYRQASSQKQDNQLYNEKLILDSKLNEDSSSSRDRVPQIRMMSLAMENVKLNIGEEEIEVGHVTLQLHAPSVLELYRSLAAKGHLSSEIPDWFTACVERGKTHTRIRYE